MQLLTGILAMEGGERGELGCNTAPAHRFSHKRAYYVMCCALLHALSIVFSLSVLII